MSTTTSPEALNLEELKIKTVETLDERGWTAGEWESEDGKVCLHGAIRLCSPQIGDNAILETLARKQGATEEWNDLTAEGAERVREAVIKLDVSDAALETAFGPNWADAVQALRDISRALDGSTSLRGEGFGEVFLRGESELWGLLREAAITAFGYRTEGGVDLADVFEMSDISFLYPDNCRAMAGFRAIVLNGQLQGFSAEEYELATAFWAEHVGPVPAYRKAGS